MFAAMLYNDLIDKRASGKSVHYCRCFDSGTTPFLMQVQWKFAPLLQGHHDLGDVPCSPHFLFGERASDVSRIWLWLKLLPYFWASSPYVWCFRNRRKSPMFLFSKNAVVKSAGLNDTSSHNHGSGERVPLRLSFTISHVPLPWFWLIVGGWLFFLSYLIAQFENWYEMIPICLLPWTPTKTHPSLGEMIHEASVPSRGDRMRKGAGRPGLVPVEDFKCMCIYVYIKYVFYKFIYTWLGYIAI